MNKISTLIPKYLTRKQVSEHYPIGFSHLAHMASQGRGIRYKIVGKSAVYRCDDIEDWLSRDVIEPFRTQPPKKRGRPKKQPRENMPHIANAGGEKKS